MADQYESGTQATSVIGTEYVLNATTPETTAGTFMLLVDVSELITNDVLEIRVKEKVLVGSTQRLVVMDTLGGVQAEPAWVSPALILVHGWDFTIKQTAGSTRSFPWSIRQV